jgi:hypothetical protein
VCVSKARCMFACVEKRGRGLYEAEERPLP